MSFFENFKWANRFRLIHKLLIFVLIVSFVVMVNSLSMRHYYRVDLRKPQNFTLEKFSLNVLDLLDEPVEMYIFYGQVYDENTSPTPQFIDDVRRLLKEYKSVAPEKIKVKFIDIEQQSKVAQQLALRFGMVLRNSVVISRGEQFRSISAFELYEARNGMLSGFCGERVLSNEILQLSNRDVKKIAFSTGHSEVDVDDVHPSYGGSALKEMLRQNGYRVEKLKVRNLSGKSSPSLLVIAGAQTKFTEDEIANIRQYLANGGNVLVFLSAPKLCGLEDLFFDWGILADDMLLISPHHHLGVSGETIIDHFADHPAIRPMIDRQATTSFILCQPVRLDIGSPGVNLHKITELMMSDNDTFAKRDYLQRKLVYNSAEDLAGPVPVAALSEKNHEGSGKLLVVGSVSLLSNKYFNDLGNRILVNSLVSWLLGDAEASADSIKTQPIAHYKLTLTRMDLQRIGAAILFLVLLIFLLGQLISNLRRRN